MEDVFFITLVPRILSIITKYAKFAKLIVCNAEFYTI